VDAVDQPDSKGEAEADPHPAVAPKAAARLGHRKRQLDDGKGEPLVFGPRLS
jgi:hypothetical protein